MRKRFPEDEKIPTYSSSASFVYSKKKLNCTVHIRSVYVSKHVDVSVRDDS
jgi:hypothetical protein